jgi:hypothetical protein
MPELEDDIKEIPQHPKGYKNGVIASVKINFTEEQFKKHHELSPKEKLNLTEVVTDLKWGMIHRRKTSHILEVQGVECPVDENLLVTNVVEYLKEIWPIITYESPYPKKTINTDYILDLAKEDSGEEAGIVETLEDGDTIQSIES